MRIAVAQINAAVGDFSGNQKKILEFAWKAKNDGLSDLVLFPELCLCGCPPRGLLEQDRFIAENTNALRNLADSLPEDLAVGVGYVKKSHSGKKNLNAYGIILDHDIVFEQFKKNPVRKDYFDESRYFESGRGSDVFEYPGERLGIVFGDDIFGDEAIAQKLSGQNISFLCAPSAFPFTAGEIKKRHEKAARISRQWNIPFINVNAYGANDSVIFDGRSFVINSGLCTAAFAEDLIYADFPEIDSGKKNISESEPEDEIETALVTGIRDYMKKCGFKKLHLGLSGGIDSALVACLAVKAAGAENVVCINNPSEFSSKGSKDDSRELAANLGCEYIVLPINSIYDACVQTLGETFRNKPFDITEENLQSRIRGVLWMAYSNKFNSMLLSGGNKSELAMGYCTLYGDTNGALAPIGDLYKTEVIALCERINKRSIAASGKKIIPQAILDKPPSAELRPGQKDEDSLPPYEVLDKILKLLIEENLSAAEVISSGFEKELVEKIVRTIARSEWKRRQTPPVLRVSSGAFGPGMDMPLARSIYEV